jgi:molecular chaperone GrpE
MSEHEDPPAAEPEDLGPSDSGDDETVDDLETEVALTEARAEITLLKDKWLRALADHENFKKRVRRDTDDAVQQALARLLSDFLPVGDNLDRAISAAGSVDPQIASGIRMVIQQFLGALAKHDIRPIEALGKSFDPSLHDALQQLDSPDHAPGVIISEFERGYTRGERLIRPARVLVAGSGSTGSAAEKQPEE